MKKERKSSTIPINLRGKNYTSPKKSNTKDYNVKVTNKLQPLTCRSNNLLSRYERLQPVLPKVRVNETYLCQMPNGHWMKAQVLASRLNPITNSTQYFVHFEGVDRRLDQWLEIDKIDTSSEHMIHLDSPSNEGSRNSPALESSTRLVDPDPDSENSDADSKSESHKTEDNETCDKNEKNNNNNKNTKETRITRNMKRLHDDVYHVGQSIDEMDPLTQRLEKEHTKKTKVKYIDKLIYCSHTAMYEINTWYFSPYPNKYAFYEEYIKNGQILKNRNENNESYFKVNLRAL